VGKRGIHADEHAIIYTERNPIILPGEEFPEMWVRRMQVGDGAPDRQTRLKN